MLFKPCLTKYGKILMNFIRIILIILILGYGCSSGKSSNHWGEPAQQMEGLPESVIEYFPLKKSEDMVSLSFFFDNETLSKDWIVIGSDPVITNNPAIEGSFSLCISQSLPKATKRGGVSLVLDLPEGDYSVSFYYRNSLDSENGDFFVFEIDGEKKAESTGFSDLWQKHTSVFRSNGEVSMSWYVIGGSGEPNEHLYNTAWIDCVSIVPDQVAKVDIIPRGPQLAVVDETTIEYKAVALRSDNSVKNDIDFDYELEFDGGSGTFNNGVFIGTSPGKVFVTAKTDTLSAVSEPITVLNSNHIEQTVVYNDTNYSGAEITGDGSPQVIRDDKIEITLPVYSSFKADAFFTVKGYNHYTGAEKYIFVRVKKGEYEYDTFLSDDFYQRIWLPYGAGIYNVEIYRCTVQAAAVDEEYDGDIFVYSWTNESDILYRFEIENTRNEDGKFLYPSGYIQSDSVEIYNLMQKESYYLGDDLLKRIVRLHDYTVAFLQYDMDSLTPAQRKKQDALSVLYYKTAVCEGYVSLYSALLRAAGIRTRAVAGTGYQGDSGQLHAWCNVEYNSNLYLVDATWDDPSPNGGNSGFVSRKYLMLETLTGDYGSHEPADERPGRYGSSQSDKFFDISVQ